MYYFASDIHLGAGDEHSARAVERRFVAWLDKVSGDAEAIFLVGDIFDFWFEYRRVVPKGFVRTLGKLAELTDRGVRVVFFTGNHDMWVGDYLTRECGMEGLHLSAGDDPSRAKSLHRPRRQHEISTDSRCSKLPEPDIPVARTLKWLFSWGVHPDLAMKFGHWWSGKSRKRHNAADEEAVRTGRGGRFRRFAHRAADRLCPPIRRDPRHRPFRFSDTCTSRATTAKGVCTW